MFEYVASGLNHSRINKNSLKHAFKADPNSPVINIINELISSIQKDNHKVSFLFNAYTEKSLGDVFTSIIRPDTIYNRYADSGGLQMVTLGHVSNEAMKEKVYKIQADYGTVGMCFDEIPVTTIGKGSVTDMSNRRFDPTMVDAKAKETGANLKRQIEVFNGIPNNKCKPMLIIQGNCYDSYNRWLDISLKEVGHNNWKYIKGISSASSSFGSGVLEYFQQLFYMTHLDLPNDFTVDHFHLLGVGSLSRLLPLMPLLKNGKIKDSTTISYDSTTHTSGISLGSYYMNKRLMDFTKYKDLDFYNIFDDINKNLAELGFNSIDEEHLFHRLSQPNLWDDKMGVNVHVYEEFFTIFAYLVSSIHNFISDVDCLRYDNAYYEDFAISKGLLLPLNSFQDCRDFKDFSEWENVYRKVLKSKKIISLGDAPPNLNDFF